MELIIGVLLGLATVILAKTTGFSKDRSFYPLLLIVIALYYVLFAFQSYDVTALLFETTLFSIFAILAFLGHKRNLLLVVAGLVLHGVYDLFQESIPYSTEAPDWWAMFCLGFDITLAAGLAISVLLKKRK